jgi:hypothetical protein
LMWWCVCLLISVEGVSVNSVTWACPRGRSIFKSRSSVTEEGCANQRFGCLWSFPSQFSPLGQAVAAVPLSTTVTTVTTTACYHKLSPQAVTTNCHPRLSPQTVSSLSPQTVEGEFSPLNLAKKHCWAYKSSVLAPSVSLHGCKLHVVFGLSISRVQYRLLIGMQYVHRTLSHEFIHPWDLAIGEDKGDRRVIKTLHFEILFFQ